MSFYDLEWGGVGRSFGGVQGSLPISGIYVIDDVIRPVMVGEGSAEEGRDERSTQLQEETGN
jgi:hypothetical protein